MAPPHIPQCVSDPGLLERLGECSASPSPRLVRGGWIAEVLLLVRTRACSRQRPEWKINGCSTVREPQAVLFRSVLLKM